MTQVMDEIIKEDARQTKVNSGSKLTVRNFAISGFTSYGLGVATGVIACQFGAIYSLALLPLGIAKPVFSAYEWFDNFFDNRRERKAKHHAIMARYNNIASAEKDNEALRKETVKPTTEAVKGGFLYLKDATNGILATLTKPAQEAIKPDSVDVNANVLPKLVRLEKHLNDGCLVDSLFCGIDDKDQKVYLDLNKLAHVIIAGMPNSGKSSLAMSLVTQLALDTVNKPKIYLCDASVRSFGPFNEFVAMTPENRIITLQTFMEENTRRSELLHSVNATDHNDYQRKTGKALPAHILFYDELLKEINKSKTNIAKDLMSMIVDSRAQNMHVVIIGQSFSAKDFDTSLTTNFEAIFQFKTKRASVSRMLIPGSKSHEIREQGQCDFDVSDIKSGEFMQAAYIKPEVISAMLNSETIPAEAFFNPKQNQHSIQINSETNKPVSYAEIGLKHSADEIIISLPEPLQLDKVVKRFLYSQLKKGVVSQPRLIAMVNIEYPSFDDTDEIKAAISEVLDYHILTVSKGVAGENKARSVAKIIYETNQPNTRYINRVRQVLK